MALKDRAAGLAQELSVRSFANKLRDTIDDAVEDGVISPVEEKAIARGHALLDGALTAINDDTSLPAETSPLFSKDNSMINSKAKNLHSSVPVGHKAEVRKGFELNALSTMEEDLSNPAIHIDLSQEILDLKSPRAVPTFDDLIDLAKERALDASINNIRDSVVEDKDFNELDRISDRNHEQNNAESTAGNHPAERNDTKGNSFSRDTRETILAVV